MSTIRALAKIAIPLILLPILITYFHVRRSLSILNICFVGPTTEYDTNDIYGTYSTLQQQQPSKQKIQSADTIIFHQIPPSPHKITWYNIISHIGLPSSHTVSNQLKISYLDENKPTLRNTNGNKIKWMDNKWCLLTSSNNIYCSSPYDSNIKQIFPVSGIWEQETSAKNISKGTNENATPSYISVQCPKNQTPAKMNKKQSKKQRKVNKNLQQILNKPSTTLLLCLNFYLAFHYWNNRIPPSSVSKIYNRIVPSPPHELWRSYSGAFAHFDLMHIGFNMMNLYSMGEALEGVLYSSIEFLYYNLALVVFTTCIMMFISYVRIVLYNNTSIREASTVGYSAVLFAWMVILAMEMDHTCPIPFLPEMCFDTYTFIGFKFNIAPIVQLIIAQMIMPRVSFVGHLSGIICGFLLHWGLLPLSFIVPQVLLPFVMVLHLVYVQKIATFSSSSFNHSYSGIEAVEDEEEDVMEQGNATPQPNSKETYKLRIKTYLFHLRNILIVTSILSMFFVDIAMILSQVLTTLLFHYAYQSYMHHNGEKQKSITSNILRIHIFSVMLLIITDSMALASWIATTSTYLITEIHQRIVIKPIFLSYIMMLLRIAINLISFIISTKLLTDLAEFNDSIVLLKVASFVMDNARIVGDVLFAPIFNPFEGRGVALGTFYSNNNASRRT